MKIKKILNNNAVVIYDGEQEKVAMGSGIAFGKRKNDPVNSHQIEKVFVMKENEKLQQLLSRIPEEHFTISEEIITYAEQYIGIKLNEHIHIALTDHISFAIERVKEGTFLKNKLLQEIKVLYKKELEIGLWAISHMKEKCKLDIPVDEAAYIALHIHTMKPQGGDMRQTVKQTTIVRDMLSVISAYEKFAILAAKIYEGLGGDENVIAVDNCTTRLRIEVKNMEAVDQNKIKATGVPGINIVGPQSIQVIVGTSVQFVADEIEKLHK
ncbi:PRD domain-containing protein [Bacillus sp. Bva_UNVM-123]|uniref:PRD domain-containing protein n=1 Tax=Bacillus sp. Bva_UNVM-123 TaxID=2829798 RepID=UPI00391EE91F